MKTSNPELKMFIMDLIIFEDDLDDKGQRVRRSQFSKQVFKGTMSLRKKLTDGIELGVYIDPTIPLIEWKKPSEVTQDMKIVVERHTDAEIEFAADEIDAVDFFYEQRKELPIINPSAFDEFEKLLG